MNDFFGIILQSNFYACCYILPLGTPWKPMHT